jgi:hypothetical protein
MVNFYFTTSKTRVTKMGLQVCNTLDILEAGFNQAQEETRPSKKHSAAIIFCYCVHEMSSVLLFLLTLEQVPWVFVTH